MFTFSVRPGYKSKELLLEFRSGSGSDAMIAAMKAVLAKVKVDVIEKIDLWQNDEIIYRMTSSLGEFELSSDNYGCIFIIATENQDAIKKLGHIFASSEYFQEEVVNFADYA
jgi:hypothetical protein